MALKTVSLTVGDIEFQTTQFPAMRALEVMVSLQRLAAPAQGVNSNTQLSNAAPALMANLEPGAARKLVLDLLECTTALVRTPQSRLIPLNKQENIDFIFSGKLKMLFDVMGHAIEVNFGDFSEGSEDPAPTTQTPEQ
jgi:hypothetical protein